MPECDHTGCTIPSHHHPGQHNPGQHNPGQHPSDHHRPDDAPSSHASRDRPARQQPPDTSAFLETIILLLMPYFLETAGTVAGARIEILRTLSSYAACTRPSMLLAAQVIALGVTTLDALHEARTIEMSVPMRLRYRSNANSLIRTMLRTEESLLAALDDEATPDPVAAKPSQAQPTTAQPTRAQPTTAPTTTAQPVRAAAAPTAPAPAEPASAEPVSAQPSQAAAPAPEAKPSAPIAQSPADPAAAARAAATVMDAFRSMGLALPASAAPTGRIERLPSSG